MKIAQVTMHYLPITGGQQTYIENLNKILAKNQHHCTVFQPYKPGIHQDNVTMMFHIPKLNRYIDSFSLLNFKLRFYKKSISSHDVVISHYPYHYPALKWHKNVIVVSHGVDWHEPATTRVDKNRVRAALLCGKNRPHIVANDSHFLQKIGVSVDPATRYFEEIEKNVWFIPNCVNTRQFHDKGMDRENVVLVPRTVRWERGIHLAIEAFSHFQKDNPDFRLHIAGFFQENWEYYQRCKQLVDRLKLNDAVHFLGPVPWNELVDHYNTAKLTLVPTLALEGTSLSALESMACKTPCISTDIAGLRDLPTVKSSTDAEDMATQMNEVMDTWQAVSDKQYTQVASIFNLQNWEMAWLNAITNARKSKRTLTLT